MFAKKSIKKLREKDVKTIGNAEGSRVLTAKTAMIKPVFLYEADSPEKMIKKLKREDTNVCIVVTKDKKFVGAVSVEDLIKLFLHQVKYELLTKELNVGYRRKFMYKKVKDLINEHKSTVVLDTPINKVIELLYKEEFHYIPIIDEKKSVIGVVTPSSVLNCLEHY